MRKLSKSIDRFSFYDGNGTWHSIPMSWALMAQHMHREHKMSVRQINIALGLTDLEVKTILGDQKI